MKNTWMPTVAGILDIVAGALALLAGIILIAGIGVYSITDGCNFPMHMSPAILSIMAIPFLVLSILAIVGGIFALNRKKWGWALTGSIVALFLNWPLAVVSIVLTVIAQKEFDQAQVSEIAE